MNGRRGQPATVRPSHGVRSVDVIGAMLIVMLIGWILLVGAATGRDPRPMASLVGLCGVTAFVARSITRRWNTVVPATLLTVLMGAIVVTWPAAIHPTFGLTGYANANGALYVIGVGTAGLLVMRSGSAKVRFAAVLAGFVLAILPWLFTSNMASASAVIVVAVSGWLFTARDQAPGRPCVFRTADGGLWGSGYVLLIHECVMNFLRCVVSQTRMDTPSIIPKLDVSCNVTAGMFTGRILRSMHTLIL